MNDQTLAETAASQQTYTISVGRSRPNFYDRFSRPITGTGQQLVAILFPGQTASWNAMPYLSDSGKQQLQSGMSGNMPFILQLSQQPPVWAIQNVVSLGARLEENSLYTHLIGYTNAEGSGVCGLERIFDRYLSANTVTNSLRFSVNAVGAAIEGSDIKLLQPQQNAAVTLTTDNDIQQICENAADMYINKGAVVVMDVQTSEVLAWVSRPNYNRLDVASELTRQDGALLDRVNIAYPPGSVFKVVAAAAALEQGADREELYECTGSITVGGNTYSCNNRTAHGEVDMKGALTQSCNCYFINLGQQIGGEAIIEMAESLGFGKEISIFGSESYFGGGNLPAEHIINRTGELCLCCFGQGELLATPLTLCSAMAAVANGGSYTVPSVIQSVGDSVAEPSQPARAMSEQTAQFLTECLSAVVSDGTGIYGKSELCSSAAKTGTAQTGGTLSDGRQELIGWYCGFFPAENPKYAVCVMMEDVRYGSSSAGPVFKNILEEICKKYGV